MHVIRLIRLSAEVRFEMFDVPKACILRLLGQIVSGVCMQCALWPQNRSRAFLQRVPRDLNGRRSYRISSGDVHSLQITSFALPKQCTLACQIERCKVQIASKSSMNFNIFRVLNSFSHSFAHFHVPNSTARSLSLSFGLCQIASLSRTVLSD